MDSATQNKADKLLNQALEYYLGIGKQKNLIRAKLLLNESVDLGSTKALNFLGDWFIKNELPSNEYKEAIVLYRRGCELGDSLSFYRLGSCYEKGVGVTKDPQKALELYREAYNAGFIYACFAIALLYKNGIGVERSLSQVVKWYKIGSDLGNTECTCNLAFSYYRGAGVQKDIDKAKDLYLICAKDSILAQKNLGVIFYKGTPKSSPDLEQAIYWLTQASENGDVSAMLYLAKILRANKRKEDAMDWYRKAALLDKKEGAYKYAFFLYKYSDEKKWNQPFKWMKIAAENNHVSAQFMLGLFYKCGIGTEADHAKAFYWLNLAAENDYEQAYSHIGRYYRDGRIVAKNYQTALVWFEKAITSKDTNVRSEALFDYGIMFLEGLGVKKNRNKAIDFLTESKNNGCLNAINKLKELNNPEASVKSFGRAYILEHGDIIQYVKMKIEDGYSESNWVDNILVKLIVYVDYLKKSDLVKEIDNGYWQLNIGNVDYAQWVLMVSDLLQLFCLNNEKRRSYFPQYFANLPFLTKKGKKFKAMDLRHNMSAINNSLGCVGEKNYEKIKDVVDSATKDILQKFK